MSKIERGKSAKVKETGKIGKVLVIDELLNEAEIQFGKNEFKHYKIKELEPVEDEVGSFQELGSNIGKLVEKKQLAYGNSIDKTYKLMQVFLEGYDNGDNTYTIPKSLLKHILLQVRIIDKQNRIFSNPDGDLMEENPYSDCAGYSLLGMRMVKDGSH